MRHRGWRLALRPFTVFRAAQDESREDGEIGIKAKSVRSLKSWGAVEMGRVARRKAGAWLRNGRGRRWRARRGAIIWAL